MGSRGSVIPFFISQISKGELPITDERMTRFMITLEEGVKLVWHAFDDMLGGEIYVKKIPSMKITDIALSVAPNLSHKIIGIRPGEKIHEDIITKQDSRSTYQIKNCFILLSDNPILEKIYEKKFKLRKVEKNFCYNSRTNSEFLSVNDLRKILKNNNFIK